MTDLDQALLEAVRRVDVMDVAGRIVANPRRASVSIADQIALALAVEAFQSIALEAEQLVIVIDKAADATPAELPALRVRCVGHCEAILAGVSALRGDTNTDKQETYNGR